MALLDLLRTQALIYEEVQRIRSLLVDRMLPPLASGSPEEGPEPRQALSQLLRGFQALLLKHPVAAQAVFSALIAEGRRFAATPEGAAWKESLASSELVSNGRQLWDALSLNLLEENPTTVIPSAYLDALFRAATSEELEQLLKGLDSQPTRGGSGEPVE